MYETYLSPVVSVYIVPEAHVWFLSGNSQRETRELRSLYVTEKVQRALEARGGGGALGYFLVGMCRPGLQIGTPF